jgi:two-component system, OmpR family, response regulator
VGEIRLLVVEDDGKLVRVLRRGLQSEGYQVDVARTGPEALAHADNHQYDAVLLDLMLPGIDGFAVCEALRQREPWIPVLMVTALTDIGDRIRGLDAGADDYLVKPFDFGELLARLRALIRRASEHARTARFGDLEIDRYNQVVTVRGQDIELTQREFAVFEVLARQRGEVVSRHELLAHVWDEGYEGSPNVVDVYVGYLRRKLEQPLGRRVIQTVRGQGFVLDLK